MVRHFINPVPSNQTDLCWRVNYNSIQFIYLRALQQPNMANYSQAQKQQYRLTLKNDNRNNNNNDNNNINCVWLLLVIDQVLLLRTVQTRSVLYFTFLSQCLKTCQRLNLLSYKPLISEIKTMWHLSNAIDDDSRQNRLIPRSIHLCLDLLTGKHMEARKVVLICACSAVEVPWKYRA
jgi:hypothetical protein